MGFVQGNTNCAGCAVAGDATLKGFPSSAINHGVTSTNYMLAEFGVKSWQTGNTTLKITKTMGGLGDGATGIVFGYRGAG